VEHAAIGTVVAGLGVLALAPAYPPATLVALFLAGVAGSVLVDLDHFPIVWALAGDRAALGRALADPPRALTDPEYVFPHTEFPWVRIASHLLLGGALAAAAATADPRLAAYVLALLGAHVGADLLRDHELA
ncbi:MAG: hypothetical protein ABEH77_06315, partial [Halobacteriaceae archaeon]